MKKVMVQDKLSQLQVDVENIIFHMNPDSVFGKNFVGNFHIRRSGLMHPVICNGASSSPNY